MTQDQFYYPTEEGQRQEVETVQQPEPAPMLPAMAHPNPPTPPANPMDVDVQGFADAIERRDKNRKALVKWIKGALVKGVDFDNIAGRKDTMLKPGAEKVCGMLGLVAHFPTLPNYEQLALSGRPMPEHIILRCQLIDGGGRVVADGVGARNLEEDKGDVNKCLKMAEKSAMIDATLRCAGLSEIFTQDLEDMQKPRAAEPKPDPDKFVPFGKNKGKAWTSLTDKQLNWYATEADEEEVREAAQGELNSRRGISDEVQQELGDDFLPADYGEEGQTDDR